MVTLRMVCCVLAGKRLKWFKEDNFFMSVYFVISENPMTFLELTLDEFLIASLTKQTHKDVS